jgi:hypothetical protein
MIMDKLIKTLEELNETGAIGYSIYKELMMLARELQVTAEK